MKQTDFFKRQTKSYGGELMKKRKGRTGPRPLSTRDSMHLVLRSSKARGAWSFKRTAHDQNIRRIVRRFASKYHVQVLSLANVGNHLHFQVKLARRHLYKPFIRAITAAIAMAVTGASRWTPVKTRFWDHRPFTRIIAGRLKDFLNLRNYIWLNQLEGDGHSRDHARMILRGRQRPFAGFG